MLTKDELVAIRSRANEATPGPWHVVNDDDDACMNLYAVTTDPKWEFGHEPLSYEAVIALTLLQSPRLVCHASHRWNDDALFLAHARADIPALLDALERAEALLVEVEQELYRRYLNDIWRSDSKMSYGLAVQLIDEAPPLLLTRVRRLLAIGNDDAP